MEGRHIFLYMLKCDAICGYFYGCKTRITWIAWPHLCNTVLHAKHLSAVSIVCLSGRVSVGLCGMADDIATWVKTTNLITVLQEVVANGSQYEEYLKTQLARHTVVDSIKVDTDDRQEVPCWLLRADPSRLSRT